MTRSVLLGAGVGGAILVFAFSIATARIHQAESTVDAAAAELASLVGSAARLAELRTRPQVIASQRIPETTIVESLNRCLRQSAIPTSQLGNVAPAGTESAGIDGQSESGPAGERLVHRTQAMRVSVVRLTPEQIGRFLITWAEEEPLWRISRISMTHARRGGGSSGVRSGRQDSELNRYDLTLEMITTYATYSAAGAGTANSEGSGP